jgi:hypothetical protein
MLDSAFGGQASMLGGSGENKWFWGFFGFDCRILGVKWI